MNPVTATQPIRARAWVSYPLAVLLSVVALLVKLQLGGIFNHSPFLLSLVAVSVSAFVGGAGPGILAAIASGLLAAYYLIPPQDSLTLLWPQGWIAMGAFALVSAIVIVLINGVLKAYEIRHQGERRLRELNAELEARVAERTAQLEAEAAERREAEATIRQMQKIESIGQLTGGIAHDFNNMLAIVTGSLDMAKRRLRGTDEPKVAQSIDNPAEGARHRESGLRDGGEFAGDDLALHLQRDQEEEEPGQEDGRLHLRARDGELVPGRRDRAALDR